MNKIRYALPGVGILALAVAGALTQDVYLLYGVIIAICIVVILVTFNKLGREYYPYLLFFIGLSLLYQATLMSPGLVGTDVHGEYNFYLLAEQNGWDPSIPHAYNSCIGIVLIAPFISKILHIDGIWVFKAIYPFLFAFVPVLLYFIFKKQFGDKVAFLSTFFFIVVPTWSLEMIGLPRQMLGELMFALCAFLIIVSNWRLKVKVPLLAACVILGALFHYVMGPVILFYLGVSTIILLFFKRRTFPVKCLTLIVIILLVASVGYYGWVSTGLPLRGISEGLEAQVSKILPQPSTPTTPTTPDEPGKPDEPSLLEKQEPLIRTAFGLDFMEVSPLGKTFRIFQFGTQLFLVLGCVYLFIHKKRYTPEYLSFAGASVILMLACVLIPRFANIINATRLYHIILFFLAPALILGGRLIMINLKVLTLCLLIPHFLFTSGVLFEAFQQEDISIINIPYSIVLSHKRVDIAAVVTKNDIKVRDWVVRNKLEPLFFDINAMMLFSEKLSPFTWRHIIRKDVSKFEDGWAYLPKHVSELPSGAYIFLRERNVQKEVVTFKPNWFAPTDTATGRRQSYSFQYLGLDKALEEYEVIYQVGDAVLLKVR